MSVKVENLEKNMAKLTVEVEADRLDQALEKAYNRQKKSISIPGFRKGKVPRQMIEKMYGPEIFYDDASNFLLQETYPDAYDESALEIVSQPEIEIIQIKKGQPFIYTALVAVKPPVKLGEYKGIEVVKIDTDVTDEEVEDAIKEELSQNGRIVEVDRPAEDRDMLTIDFEGFVDGEPFDGGTGEDYPLTIGSGTFIPGFEEQLIGHEKDEEVDVNVTFPEDYHAAALAGKPALFKVKIKEVQANELPEFNEEYVQDISEFDTIEAYKEDVKKKLIDTKEKNARYEQEDEAIRKIVEAAEMDIPEPMIDHQVNQLINDMAGSMMQQGLSLDQYMQMTGMNIDKLRAQTRPEALQRIQSSLVLEAIADAEGIEATEEDIDGELEKMARMYGMKVEDIKGNLQDSERENIKTDIRIQKAVDLVFDQVKKTGKPKTHQAASEAKDTEETEA